jgi:hypothetical protein
MTDTGADDPARAWHELLDALKAATKGSPTASSASRSHASPRIPELDWISTAGERQGTFFIRRMSPTSMLRAPTCRLERIAAPRD